MRDARQTEPAVRRKDTPERKYSASSLHICVDRYGEDMEGRFYSKMSSRELKFASVGELLLRADALFDRRGYPQNFQEKRSFDENAAWDGRYEAPKILRADEDIRSQNGKLCTIDVVVVSRRHASWQGILMNRGRPAKSFESAKELMELLLAEVERQQESA